jgi:hypothetical protein
MKLIIDFAASQITIEGDGPELVSVLQAARDVAPMISEIKLLTGGPVPKREEAPEPQGGGGLAAGGGSRKNWKTMREFTRWLGLASIAERLTGIAYYVKIHEGKTTFTAKEMDGWFTLCGFEKPAQMSVALSDAKRKAGTMDGAGYGNWKLTTTGENLITRKVEEAGEKVAEGGGDQ